jgi:hypothetical protein
MIALIFTGVWLSKKSTNGSRPDGDGTAFHLDGLRVLAFHSTVVTETAAPGGEVLGPPGRCLRGVFSSFAYDPLGACPPSAPGGCRSVGRTPWHDHCDALPEVTFNPKEKKHGGDVE